MRRRGRKGPRRRCQEFRRKLKAWGVFLLLLLLVVSVASWWNSLPAPEESKKITCPDIEEVLGEPTWDEYKVCQAQYITQLVWHPVERFIYRANHLKPEYPGI